MTTLHALLRAATADAHARIEARLALLDPDLTEHRYVAVLTGMHAFHAPLEPRLRALDAWRGDRARWLDEDLGDFGCPRPSPAVDLPAIRDASDAFGCAYVLEGASLGGVVIARGLRGRFGDGGLRFFLGEGPQVGARWRDFLTRLEASWRATPLDEGRVTRAAVDTFEALERCLERAGALAR